MLQKEANLTYIIMHLHLKKCSLKTIRKHLANILPGNRVPKLKVFIFNFNDSIAFNNIFIFISFFEEN